MRRLNVSVIGAGVFGGYHCQKVAQSEQTEFVGIFDQDTERARAISEAHGVQVLASVEDGIEKSDALIIATPPSTHFDLAKIALERGKHVLVEKPLAVTLEEANLLVDIASAGKLVLQAGHQERMVFEAMGLFSTDEAPIAIQSVRAGPPTGRSMDVSVIDDLMIHDIDLALRLTGGSRVADVKTVWAGSSGSIDRVEASGMVGGCALKLFADRQAPDRQRQMQLVYPNGSVFIDFLNRTIENTTPYRFELDVSDTVPDPLKLADEAFFAACLGEGKAFVAADEARDAVGVAEAFRDACTESARTENDPSDWQARSNIKQV